MFQVEDLFDEYMKGNPPEWMRRAVKHVGWIFESYPLTAAYLNLATEVMFDFVLGEESALEEEDFREFKYLRVSPNEVLKVLEASYLIQRTDGQILPGRLLEELRSLRLTEYEISSMEFTEKVREARGALAVAVTIGLLRLDRFVPQRPLTLFRILAQNIFNSGLDDGRAIDQTMSQVSFQAACNCISSRQTYHLIWHMSGFSSGQPYVIKNLDEDDRLVFDDDMLDYMSNMRERYRERLRSRVRSR